LLGKSNVAGPTLSSLATNFGLSPLIGKPLAIVSDARLSSRTDAATITERLLSISGEDAITIDRKFATPVTVRLPTRFMILTNEIPRLGDASGALASRFVILSMTKSWLGAEDKRLEKKLLAELSSILLWAIQGWDNLNRQERFTEPKNSQQIVEEMEDLASPVAAFVRDCCNVGQGHNVATTDLYDAWKDYCEEHGKLKVSDERVFGRDLRATTPEINKERIRIGGHRMIRYLGIGLRNENEY
jgi:putative DNA primase/helicase